MNIKKLTSGILPSTSTASIGALAVFFLTVLTLSLTLPSVLSELVNPLLYRQGEIANYTVRAPRDFLIEDTLNTEERRAQAREAVARVFTLEFAGEEEITNQLDALFASIKDLPQPATSDLANDSELHKARSAIERRFNIDLAGEEWEAILDSKLWVPIEAEVRGVVVPVLKKGVILNKRSLLEIIQENQVAVLRDPNTNVERELKSVRDIYDLRQAARVVSSAIPSEGYGKGPVFSSIVNKLADSILVPNVVLDSAESNRRVSAAAQSVEPIFYRIKRGEVIVRAGDRITASQERRLLQLQEEVRPSDLWRAWAGYFILTAIVLLTAYYCTITLWPHSIPATQDLSLVALTLIGSFLLIKLFSVLATSLGNMFFYFDPGTFVLAAPLAAGGIMLQVTLGAPAVLMFVVAFALLSGVFLENSWVVLVLVVVGNIVGAISVKSCSRRSAFLWAGARVALINVLIVICFLMLYPQFSTGEKASRVLWAVFGGAFSGFLAFGITPIAEFFGRYVTDIKLLELASLDHPLLRELSVQAPGTWNHSMVLGQLGESAAKSIGANALLTQVGAYYHDIGKMKKPAYFVENQTKENRHDKLTPSMSALIIKKHVKDGVELAGEHGLPQAIIDFIAQHHGTSLIEYFYVKAHKDLEEGDVVEETHYRYPGPKPQSREVGILMLADAIEATSRTLADPTPAKIQGLVQRMINKVFASGELDESNLTLRDLHLIAKSFTRVLTGIYHRRIEYEDAGDKTKDQKASGKGAEDASEVSKEASQRSGDERKKDEDHKRDGSKDNASPDGGKRSGEGSSKKSDSKSNKETLKRLGI